jgi:dihydrofolate reductase
MRKIIVTEFATLDLVMEAPGGEPTHPHSGWVGGYFNDDIGSLKYREVVDADAHLLGRVTYESFAGAWPDRDDEFADRINAMPKYVVSTSIDDPGWNNVTVLRDLEGVAGLDGNVLVAGSCRLVHALFERDLVDELRLMVFPVTIGAGLRVFPDEQVKRPWSRTDSVDFANGVRYDTYRKA